MQDKLNQYIEGAAQTLHLNKIETEYLTGCMEMAYIIGHGVGTREGIDLLASKLNIGADRELQK